jgi:hypothetical protein
MMIHTYSPSFSGGRGKRIIVWGQPGQKRESLSEKQTKVKGLGDMAEVVKWLHSKCEALNSIPSATKIN